MNNEELLEFAIPIIEDFSNSDDLKYQELEKINQNLGDLVELLSKIETQNATFTDETYAYYDRNQIEELEELEELEYLELEELAINDELENLDLTRNELLMTIQENTEPVEVDEELTKLDILSKSSLLLILLVIVIFGVFYFVRYVYNSLTRHF